MQPHLAPAPPHLDVRPTSEAHGRLFLKMGVGFFAMSLVMLAAGILGILDLWPGVTFAQSCLCIGLGACGCVGFVLMAVWALGQLRSVVRFLLVGDEVIIEWRRRDKVRRTERVKRADIVEVAVTDAPSSGASSYGLVVGMRNGEIDLTTIVISGTVVPPHYVEECRRMSAFLGVPSRVP